MAANRYVGFGCRDDAADRRYQPERHWKQRSCHRATGHCTQTQSSDPRAPVSSGFVGHNTDCNWRPLDGAAAGAAGAGDDDVVVVVVDDDDDDVASVA